MNQIDIANMALQNVGANEIASIDEYSVSADAVRNYWALAFETTLRSHTWCSATRMTHPAFSDNDDINQKEYLFCYSLPADYVRFVKVKSKRCNYPRYNILGRLLYCEAEITELYYISKAVDLAECDVALINLFVLKLSELICYKLGGRADIRNYFQNKFEEALITARGQDAREVNTSRPYPSTASIRES